MVASRITHTLINHSPQLFVVLAFCLFLYSIGLLSVSYADGERIVITAGDSLSSPSTSAAEGKDIPAPMYSVVDAASEMISYCIDADTPIVCDSSSKLLESVKASMGASPEGQARNLDYLWPAISSVVLMRIHCQESGRSSLCDQADHLEQALYDIIQAEKLSNAGILYTRPFAVALLGGFSTSSEDSMLALRVAK